MANKKDIDRRLAEWQHQLWEAGELLAVDREDFDEWAKQLSSDEGAAESVRRAAKFFWLDHSKPEHAAALLCILADVLFHNRKSGRRRGSKKWDSGRLYRLGAHCEAVEANASDLTGEAVAKLIKEQYPAYKGDTVDAIRQRLPAARREYSRAKEGRAFVLRLVTSDR